VKMAQFHVKAITSFYLDGERVEAGRILGVPSLVIARDLIHRGLAVCAPAPVNGGSSRAESVATPQH